MLGVPPTKSGISEPPLSSSAAEQARATDKSPGRANPNRTKVELRLLSVFDIFT
jgi:hypothetical protein